MKHPLGSLRTSMLGTIIAALMAWPVHAQSLSNRPIRLITPYSTGVPVDVSARLLVEAISPILGVPVVVENRPRAGGKIAAEALARAEPDGHTLMYGGNTQFVMLPLLDRGFKSY